ncbi:radical SAM domain containing protein [Aureococcus anophagefferens]|nr:radical SAM domain containing protein [Aureococcus anophagefferens]
MNVAASADASAPCGGGGDVEDLMEPGDVVGVVDSVRSLAPFADAGERALHYENESVEDIYKRWDDLVKPEDMDGFQRMVLGLLDAGVPGSERALAAALAPLRKKYKLAPRKAQLLHAYRSLLSTGHLDKRCVPLEEVLTTKASKSQSGVLVVTVLTSPYPSVAGGKKQRFSCKWNCYYCPNEPGQPRSYLRDERPCSREPEPTLNESAATKIIGLTLETRPDTIDEDEIRLLRLRLQRAARRPARRRPCSTA